MERILIVRLGAMGDVIHTLPAAQALRDAYPRAMIGWLIEERWAELLCAPGTARRGLRSPQRPLVDWVLSLNLRDWRSSLFTAPTLHLIAKIWNDLRSTEYEAAFDLQGAIRSALLARWSAANVVYGGSEPRESPASLFYSRLVTTRGRHVIEQNLSLVTAVTGKALNVPQPVFPRDSVAEDAVQQKLTQLGTDEYAILNPGAGWGAKRWPAERYGQVARKLASDGLCPVINSGPGEERLTEEVVAASAGLAKPMKLSISELIALTRRAKLFVGGDTGPMHLAAALRIPVVAIFGPTNPLRNGPYGTPSVVLRNPASRTTHARRPQPDDAMLEISADAVVNSARRLLLSQRAAKGVHG
jgi:heptosyltransferase I